MTEIYELDKRITLQAMSKAPDGLGGQTVTWNDMATVWAKKTAHRSDEAVQAMSVSGIATYNIRIRFRKDVRSSWRIKEGNQYYSIVGPPLEKNEGLGRRWLDITCKDKS